MSPLNAPRADETASFYDRLMDEKEHRGIFGKENRYNPIRIVERASTRKYFVEAVRPFVQPTHKFLDLGCGPGSFLVSLAPLCGEVVGVDISKNFVKTCEATIQYFQIKNARAQHVEPGRLPFRSCFRTEWCIV